jgi:hypothetical protein
MQANERHHTSWRSFPSNNRELRPQKCAPTTIQEKLPPYRALILDRKLVLLLRYLKPESGVLLLSMGTKSTHRRGVGRVALLASGLNMLSTNLP